MKSLIVTLRIAEIVKWIVVAAVLPRVIQAVEPIVKQWLKGAKR